MPCRIGITTNPGRRKREWQEEHPNLRDWEILGRYDTRRQAQAVENRLTTENGWYSAPGGREPNNANTKWAVYKFYY
jgi:hypothetical protein